MIRRRHVASLPLGPLENDMATDGPILVKLAHYDAGKNIGGQFYVSRVNAKVKGKRLVSFSFNAIAFDAAVTNPFGDKVEA
jgi:hypothetical protein